MTDFIAAFDNLDCSDPVAFREDADVPTAAETFLPVLLQDLECRPRMRAVLPALARQARWYSILKGEGIDPDLTTRLVCAQLVGEPGPIISTTMRAGMFLFAPELYYPIHQHAATEFYLVVSGEMTVQHGRFGDRMPLGPNDLSYTPPHRLHALRTAEKPCLLIYGWIDEIQAPGWWWHQESDGSWSRSRWRRHPDGFYVKEAVEPVTPEVLAQSGEA
jgi:mannose-6-phosphate isomerase-like protein (cupin superfamily)